MVENEVWRRWSDGKVGEWAELYLPHSSFSNPSVALPTSQLILQHFRRFTYVTAHSPTLLSLLLRHRLFTYVTRRAAHRCYTVAPILRMCDDTPLIMGAINFFPSPFFLGTRERETVLNVRRDNVRAKPLTYSKNTERLKGKKICERGRIRNRKNSSPPFILWTLFRVYASLGHTNHEHKKWH